jgi:hypothetical protein
LGLVPNPNQRKVVGNSKATGAQPNIESIGEYNNQLIDNQLIIDTKH